MSQAYEIEDTRVMKDVIVDRKSKYTVVWTKVLTKENVRKFITELNKDKYFRKSTHNSYAFRIKSENGSILEWKNDDWEQWAGMCILRELQRVEWQNILLIVTRYFWWIHLHTDRFKNVIEACKVFLK